MHISGHPAALDQKRFEAHNPLELLRMERLRFVSDPAVRLTANTTELAQSGWALRLLYDIGIVAQAHGRNASTYYKVTAWLIERRTVRCGACAGDMSLAKG